MCSSVFIICGVRLTAVGLEAEADSSYTSIDSFSWLSLVSFLWDQADSDEDVDAEMVAGAAASVASAVGDAVAGASSALQNITNATMEAALEGRGNLDTVEINPTNIAETAYSTAAEMGIGVGADADAGGGVGVGGMGGVGSASVNSTVFNMFQHAHSLAAGASNEEELWKLQWCENIYVGLMALFGFIIWLRSFEIFSTHEHLGPLLISLNKMGSDVIQISIIMAVLMGGFWSAFTVIISTFPSFYAVCSKDTFSTVLLHLLFFPVFPEV